MAAITNGQFQREWLNRQATETDDSVRVVALTESHVTTIYGKIQILSLNGRLTQFDVVYRYFFLKWVTAIHRYLGDPKHDAQTGGIAGQSLDIIQLTLADSSHKIKVLLHYDLNKLVQRQELHAGSTIIINKCAVNYDETDLSGGSVVIVQEVSITGVTELTEQDLKGLSWSPDCSLHEQEDVPLTSTRGYFVSLWSSMEMFGSVWNTSENAQQGLGETKEEDLYCIRDLAKKWNSIRGANPAVLVRVILKSRMIHYAKPNKSDKWPFQAHILVADDSGACTVVLWNEMCPKFYHRITEGTLLLLKKFNVKKGFQMIPRFRPALGDQELYDIDINLNSHHPVSEVRLIDPSTFSGNGLVPPLHYKLLSRMQVGALPDSIVCDITGVVTYISRFEREPMINKHGFDSGGFWIRRWIHLRDGTSQKPFCVQLYRLTEGLKHLDIRPGAVLMLTNVRVMQKLDPLCPSNVQRHIFISSTAESQIYVVNENSSDSVRDLPPVKDVLDWSESIDGKRAVGESLVGGYFNYPPLPTSIAEIRSTMKDNVIISSEEWEKVLTGFSYREGRQLMVQAMMVFIKLKNLDVIKDFEVGSPKRKSPKKRKNIDNELILDSDLYQSDNRILSLGKGMMDGDTLPVKYSKEQWKAIKKRLDFPETELTGSPLVSTDVSDSLETRQVPYFTVSWIGLNTRILLQTILLCPHHLQPNTQFLDLLIGSSTSPTSLVSEAEYRFSGSDLRTVIDSGRHCANKRFLLVLDCYQGDGENIEIILNRAVPVADVT